MNGAAIRCDAILARYCLRLSDGAVFRERDGAAPAVGRYDFAAKALELFPAEVRAMEQAGAEVPRGSRCAGFPRSALQVRALPTQGARSARFRFSGFGSAVDLRLGCPDQCR